MIFTLFWKEWREHRTVFVAMAVLSAALLVGLAYLLDPETVQLQASAADWRVVPIGWATLVLAVTYGLVCGAMMFAGEREGKTQAFLDGLPSLRFEVWATKVVAGAFLTLAQSAVLFGVISYLSPPAPQGGGAMIWAIVLPLVAGLAYGWGLFGSALSSSVLGAIGVAVVPMLLSALVSTSALAIGPALALAGLAVPLVLAFGGLLLSGVFFTAPDWERWKGSGREPVSAKDEDGSAERPVSGRPSFPWRALVWLTARQSWPELLCYAILAPFLGLVLPSLGWIFWPLGTLLIGVLCGTAVCRPDQSEGAFKFLGDQRVPAGKAWLVKVGWWGLAALALTLLFLIAAAGHVGLSLANLSRPQAEAMERWYLPGGNVWTRSSLLGYALSWLAHGFALGHLFGLLWRKPAVSVVLSILVAPMAAVAWMPSLLGGGLGWFHVLLGPLVILAATFVVERAWLSDRLYSLRPSGLLALACLTGILWLGGNIAWRWIEVPNGGEPFDVEAFSRTVFADDRLEARSLLAQAINDLNQHESQLNTREQDKTAGGMGMAGGSPAPGAVQALPFAPGGLPGPDNLPGEGEFVPAPIPDPPVEETFQKVLREGWNASTPRFERWLDQMFTALPEQAPNQAEWVRLFREAASKPPAIIVDCRSVTMFSNLRPVQTSARAGMLFVLRAKQHFACGEETEGLDCLVVALGISRDLRHKAIPMSFTSGLAVEKWALLALTNWLQNEACQKDVIRRALAELDRHEAETPPISDAVKAAYFTMQNDINDPRNMGALLDGSGWSQPASSAVQVSAGLAVTLARMPWEKDRLERLTNVVVGGWLRAADLTPDQVQPYLDEQNNKFQFFLRIALRPWVPTTRGPDQGLTAEQVSRWTASSLLRECISPVKDVFENRNANARTLRAVRDEITQALAAMAD